jgi:hypothetical protein
MVMANMDYFDEYQSMDNHPEQSFYIMEVPISSVVLTGTPIEEYVEQIMMDMHNKNRLEGGPIMTCFRGQPSSRSPCWQASRNPIMTDDDKNFLAKGKNCSEEAWMVQQMVKKLEQGRISET